MNGARKRDRKIARVSAKEERKAVKDYGGRVERASDPKLKTVLRHNRAEEREHLRALEGTMKGKKKSGMMGRDAKREGESMRHERGESPAKERAEHRKKMAKKK